MKWGKLRLRSLAFVLPAGAKPTKVALRAAGKIVAAKHALAADRITLTLENELTLGAGESLEIVIS